MRRLIKWFFIGLGSLVGLLAAFVLVVVFVVDPNDYRSTIEDQVEQRTGRQLAIEGDLSLTFFPWFGIEMGKTRLSEAQGFGDEPFVAVDQVQLAVKVLPLLTGDLRLDTLILERPQIRLVRNAKGQANWEQFPKGEPAPEQTPEQGGAGVPAIVRGLELAGLRVRKASIVYDDRQAGQTITLDPLNLQVTDVRFGSDVPIEADWQVALGDGVRVSGELDATANVNPDLSRASVAPMELALTASGDGVPNGEQSLSVNAGVTADLAASEFRVEDLLVEAVGAELSGQAQASVPASGAPTASGSLSLAELDPRDVFANLDLAAPQTRDGDALRSVSADLTFKYADGGIRVEPLEAQFDDSQLKGWVHVRDPAKPALDFDLDLDRLNVDRYLPPASEDKTAKEDSGDQGSGETKIPTEPLRGLAIDQGKVRIGALTVSGAKMEEITVEVTADNGKIRLNPLSANLYGGKYQGDIRLDATGDKLGVAVNERLQGVQAQPLLADLAGFSRLVGQGDFTLDATTRGATVTEILDGLKGKAVFGFQDGTIDGINLAQMLRQAMARFQGNKASADEPQKTDFTTLGGTVRIDGGTLSNDDLNLKTPLMRVTGGGSANVIKREIDYRLNLNVVGSLEGQGGANLSQLKGVPIPLRISGSMMAPSFDLALGEQLEAMAKQRVDEKKEELKAKAEEKAKEKVQEKVGDKAKEKAGKAVEDKLKDLFNR
jgi:AsmA protein